VILHWIGAKFYPTPGDFIEEAQFQGISRKLNAVPADFVVGQDWMFLAHVKGVQKLAQEPKPGVFRVWMPTSVDLVVKEESREEMSDKHVAFIEGQLERHGEGRVRVLNVETIKAEQPEEEEL
jgi:hypothetical protein